MSAAREAFVLAYVREHHAADALNDPFQLAFQGRFFADVPSPRVAEQRAARAAAATLRALWSRGALRRTLIRLGDGLGSEFPRWVYSYSLDNASELRRGV